MDIRNCDLFSSQDLRKKTASLMQQPGEETERRGRISDSGAEVAFLCFKVVAFNADISGQNIATFTAGWSPLWMEVPTSVRNCSNLPRCIY